jgi:two-component system NtrC family sensor kinase
MKPTIKLILLIVAVTCAVVAGSAMMRARRASEQPSRQRGQDLAALALAAGTAVDEVWRVAGPDAASRLIESLDRNHGRSHDLSHGQGAQPARIRLLHTGAGPGDGVPGAVSVSVSDSAPDAVIAVAAFAALSPEAQAARVEERPDGLGIDLAVGDGGLLQIRAPLAADRARAGGDSWSQTALLGLLALLGGGGLLMAGLRVIDPRLQLLTSQARALAGGDYTARTDAGQEDEIGLLAGEMNRLAERLQEARERVRRDLSARTAILEQLRHGDRLSTVSKLASSMAHDLGTPLNVVSGRAMMITSTPSCPPEIASDARIIGEQASNMTKIIRHMLDHARRRDVQRARVAVRELVQRAVDLVQPLAEPMKVAIELAGPDDLVAGLDEIKVLQVLTNLMNNGLQAMPEGGSLRLQWARLEVEEPPDSRAAAGAYIRISVEDTGVGIDANALEKIFEPFFSIKGSGGGVGLGLPVCHSIIRDHGGWVEAHSRPGQGSRFDVYLPQSNDTEGENR